MSISQNMRSYTSSFATTVFCKSRVFDVACSRRSSSLVTILYNSIIAIYIVYLLGSIETASFVFRITSYIFERLCGFIRILFTEKFKDSFKTFCKGIIRNRYQLVSRFSFRKDAMKFLKLSAPPTFKFPIQR